MEGRADDAMEAKISRDDVRVGSDGDRVRRRWRRSHRRRHANVERRPGEESLGRERVGVEEQLVEEEDERTGSIVRVLELGRLHEIVSLLERLPSVRRRRAEQTLGKGRPLRDNDDGRVDLVGGRWGENLADVDRPATAEVAPSADDRLDSDLSSRDLDDSKGERESQSTPVVYSS